MKYTKYKHLIDIIAKGNPAAKFNKISKKGFVNKALRDFLRDKDFRRDPKFSDKVKVIANEWSWNNNGKTMIFPESAEVLNNIKSGKYDISYAGGIIPFSDNFIINFPDGYIIAGQPAVSTLVSFYNFNKYSESYILPLHSDAGIKLECINEDHCDDAFHIQLNYKLDGKISNIPSEISFDVQWDTIPELLLTSSYEEYKKLAHSKVLTKVGVETIGEHYEYELELLKLIVSMIVYVQANNEALVKGFPGEISLKSTDSFFKTSTATNLILKTRSKGSSPDGHYRSWYLRQLIHEKYYQGDWEGKPKGSRIIFVKDTYVNDNIDAKTLI